MVSIDVHNAFVDFPIFDAKTRSMKKKVLGKVGGKIGTDTKVPIIEALHDVTLNLREGDRVGLVGHNGAGKSTLLRLLAGIYEPTRGSARIEGKIAPAFDLSIGTRAAWVHPTSRATPRSCGRPAGCAGRPARPIKAGRRLPRHASAA